MAHYSIKDLEKMSGILAHTIRIWEKRYKLIIPQRTDTNIRVYTDDDLKKILNVSLLNRHGLKISKIAKLSAEDLQERILKLSESAENLDSQIEALVIAMIEMNEAKLVALINEAVASLGVEDAMIKVVYPFLRKTGALWQTNRINPAQEHFVTNIVRRKLFAAIDQLPEVAENAPKFVVFLPEGEYHEMGMLFSSYLLKKNGLYPIYLGQSVPFSDVVEVQQKLNADYLLSSFITSLQDFSFTEYALNLSKTFKKSKVLLMGEIAVNLELKRIPNIIAIRGAEELKTYLSKLK